jgi:polar amino acid transport system substrate-binding protein
VPIVARLWVGQSRYGCVDLAHDQRDFLGDVLEELADAAVFLAQDVSYPSAVNLRRSCHAHRWLRGGTLALAVALSTPTGHAWAQANVQPEVTVAVLRNAAPFSYQTPDGTWKGLAVDVWDLVAAQLHLDARFVGMSRSELIDAVSTGKARFGIGALSITAERLQRVDFSAPIDVTGVAIAVPYVPRSVWAVVRDALFSATFLKLVGGLLALLAAVGTIFWISERRHNPDFAGREIHGWGSGVWLSIVTMTTVGYGDKAPRTLSGRVVAAVWMFISIVLISIFTGTVATLLTVERIGPRVSGFEDLSRARIACVGASAAAQLLADRHLQTESYPDLDQALQALVGGRADALVHDRALLAAVLKERPDLPVRMLPGTVRPEYYAFAMRPDEPLRRPINLAIAHILDGEVWNRLPFDYLGDQAENH